MTYPNGRVLSYNYNTGLDSTISRLSSIADSIATLESYKYLGLDTVVERDHPQTHVNATFISQSGGTGDAGDQYTGLDRFGRVVEVNWYNTSTSSATDDFQYGYDQGSNVLFKNNMLGHFILGLLGRHVLLHFLAAHSESSATIENWRSTAIVWQGEGGSGFQTRDSPRTKIATLLFGLVSRGGDVMTATAPKLTQRPAWKAIQAHYEKVRPLHLRQLFADDPGRGERFSAEAVGIYLDYSKNRCQRRNAQDCCCNSPRIRPAPRIDAMFAARRSTSPRSEPCCTSPCAPRKMRSSSVDGENVVPEVHAVLDQMADFSDRVRSGEWTGYTGKRIRNVINIGIGGSDLGPAMAYEALQLLQRPQADLRFVSNVDGTDFAEATRDLDPAETLFIISSKTFTTLET